MIPTDHPPAGYALLEYFLGLKGSYVPGSLVNATDTPVRGVGIRASGLARWWALVIVGVAVWGAV